MSFELEVILYYQDFFLHLIWVQDEQRTWRNGVQLSCHNVTLMAVDFSRIRLHARIMMNSLLMEVLTAVCVQIDSLYTVEKRRARASSNDRLDH